MVVVRGRDKKVEAGAAAAVVTERATTGSLE